MDLVPPEDGFPEAIEEQIARFLEPLEGKLLRHNWNAISLTAGWWATS